VFSLLPPDNATGNYTKVAQHIPVKILFESKLDERVRPGMALTFGAFLQVARLFGGQAGATVIQRVVNQRELFHSHQLGYALSGADPLSDERLRVLNAGLLGASNGADDAQQRALALLGSEVRQQATTLAYADGFVAIVIALHRLPLGVAADEAE
jgi:DHA2 family multidrug resistance protein